MIKAKRFGDERSSVLLSQILNCPGARMNPELAETLAYNSTVSASVAIGVLASVRRMAAGTPRLGSAPVAWK
jgi:hypothetical protein